MSGESYRIDPGAVRTITARARADADEVTKALRGIRDAIDGACGVLLATSSRDALHSLHDDPFGIEVRATAKRIDDAADDVDASVDEFDAGDAEMGSQIGAAQRGVPGGRAVAR